MRFSMIKTAIGLIFLLSMSYSLAERDPFILSPSTQAAAMKKLIIPIHYADAKLLAAFLNSKKSGILSKFGYAAADVRTNQLWIREEQTHIYLIQSLLSQLDIPIHQVLIKARIISISDHNLHSLGILFGTKTNNAQSNDGLIEDKPNSTIQFGVADIPIIKFKNGQLLDLTLSALEQEGRAQVLSCPELMTNNRQTAIIESGEAIPYQEKTGQGNTSVTFKKATLRLKVTPVVLPGNRILLQLNVNQDKMSSFLVNGVPTIQTQQLTTKVMVNNQETVVLGGIYEQSTQQEEAGIPGIHKIPILGGLFRHRQRSSERKQLLIFVTPQIISPYEKKSHQYLFNRPHGRGQNQRR
ncbi:secretin N-terminal domain-containing protein [Coxiella burnetii]|uniref:secretin N-terminal domain-containing protein n=1 Tax=Coxiella burnetii TaxID=777 RepID=UPI0021AD8879|nr:secretin N-terminal domain-containing protein [Coxiella burnetii]